ncbi:MarR family transcriptional regulator [uncultured Pontibacter sp.]|uniref:GbsR/MarR family transcriptional regulator n=1 Tax=uncultured Pontibacter sp. TaxID=453356 RepID=UPI00261D2828|nr:MarR family transcriptional regulator [uncultured Pontibacter sp.]
MSIKLDDKHKALIEKIGIAHEEKGLQPVAGRILGLLYVSPRPELTFDEIRETLNISKSATSTALNLLMHIGHIDYTTFSGNRKRYFRLKVGNWRDLIQGEIEKVIKMSHVLKEVLAVRGDETPTFNCSIEEFADFMQFMHKEFPVLLQRWEQTKNKE